MNNFTAFQGSVRIASGEAAVVSERLKTRLAEDPAGMFLVFEDSTGQQVDLDLRASPAKSRPGRPKLGVVPREVTLLPRHWEWLATQPGGASVALRKLVEEARRVHAGADAIRQSREAAYRFMLAAGGDLPGYEEATRALFAGDQARFDDLLATWPADLRNYASGLAATSWG